jgi:hypothetical protein
VWSTGGRDTGDTSAVADKSVPMTDDRQLTTDDRRPTADDSRATADDSRATRAEVVRFSRSVAHPRV